MLFLLVVSNRFHEDDFGLHILRNLFYLEFPEVGYFNLDLATGYSNYAVFRRLYTFADFLAFTNINLHNGSSHHTHPFIFIIFLSGK